MVKSFCTLKVVSNGVAADGSNSFVDDVVSGTESLKATRWVSSLRF